MFLWHSKTSPLFEITVRQNDLPQYDKLYRHVLQTSYNNMIYIYIYIYILTCNNKVRVSRCCYTGHMLAGGPFLFKT